MKHLKKFENLSKLKDWGRLLSDEDFKKYAEEFDNIVDIFIDYVDLGYEIRFETAYGAKVAMKYEDYVAKNVKYEEFIHGLPARGLFFTLSIKMPYDFKQFITIVDDVNNSSTRLESLDWVIKSFDVHGLPEKGIKNNSGWMKPHITITYDFESTNIDYQFNIHDTPE